MCEFANSKSSVKKRIKAAYTWNCFLRSTSINARISPKCSMKFKKSNLKRRIKPIFSCTWKNSSKMINLEWSVVSSILKPSMNSVTWMHSPNKSRNQNALSLYRFKTFQQLLSSSPIRINWSRTKSSRTSLFLRISSLRAKLETVISI